MKNNLLIALIAVAFLIVISNALAQEFTVQGYVRDTAGKPVKDAKVAVDGDSCYYGPVGSGSGLTDASGKYYFTFLISGGCEYNLMTPSKAGCMFTPPSSTKPFAQRSISQDFKADCTAPQACTGNCKTSQCSSYTSCTTATGTCSTGYCCTGTCTTPTPTSETASMAELKTVLIQAIKDYFSNTSKLTVSEIKDLIILYLSTTENTASLSGTGKYSKENLIDIYNKAKGTNNSWLKVADEWGTFHVDGTKWVRFVAGDNWIKKQISTGAGNTQCSNNMFGGDPAPGIKKECQVWTGTDAPPSTPGEIDPSIPSITGTIRLADWGTMGSVSSLTEVKKYYINLPDGLPALPGIESTPEYPNGRSPRNVIPKGTPYTSLNIVVVDAVAQMHGSGFDVTLTDPNGKVYEGSLMEAMTLIYLYNNVPPGRYLLTVKANRFAPIWDSKSKAYIGLETSAQFIVGISTSPWLLKEERK